MGISMEEEKRRGKYDEWRENNKAWRKRGNKRKLGDSKRVVADTLMKEVWGRNYASRRRGFIYIECELWMRNDQCIPSDLQYFLHLPWMLEFDSMCQWSKSPSYNEILEWSRNQSKYRIDSLPMLFLWLFW